MSNVFTFHSKTQNFYIIFDILRNQNYMLKFKCYMTNMKKYPKYWQNTYIVRGIKVKRLHTIPGVLDKRDSSPTYLSVPMNAQILFTNILTLNPNSSTAGKLKFTPYFCGYCSRPSTTKRSINLAVQKLSFEDLNFKSKT